MDTEWDQNKGKRDAFLDLRALLGSRVRTLDSRYRLAL
jgi:hypothetical protein